MAHASSERVRAGHRVAVITAAASITCVPPASVPAGGGGPAPGGGAGSGVDAGAGGAGDGAVDAGGPGVAIDAGAGPVVDAVVPGAIDRSPPPRTLVPEQPASPPPPLRYPLEAMSARAAADIERDLATLEPLVPTTPAADPERPMLLWRVAAAHRELASVRSADPAASAAVAAAERAQIAALATLRADHPTWCAAPNPTTPTAATGCGDEQAYLAARALQRLGDVAEARKLYLKLLQSWPSSRLTAAAYAALGDMFLDAALADPSKLALAQQSFTQVVGTIQPADPLYGQVRHRLAYVAWLGGDGLRAVRELQQAIEVSLRFPATPGALIVAERARADLLPVYVLAGDAKRAHDFIRPLSGDSAGATECTISWLDRLWAAYAAAGAPQAAIELIDDLALRDPAGPRWCARAVERLELTAWAVGGVGSAPARVDSDVAVLLDLLAKRAVDAALLRHLPRARRRGRRDRLARPRRRRHRQRRRPGPPRVGGRAGSRGWLPRGGRCVLRWRAGRGPLPPLAAWRPPDAGVAGGAHGGAREARTLSPRAISSVGRDGRMARVSTADAGGCVGWRAEGAGTAVDASSPGPERACPRSASLPSG
jgi:tetratricopeptide (TPR) repeat protein